MRKVGVSLGLIQKLENVASHNKINIDQEFYQRIIRWKELHRGHHADLHRWSFNTIGEGKCERDLETMNMPKVAAQELATLIFNERCEITVSDDGFNEFIKDVLKKDAFNSNFQQYLEFMFAYGGMVMKPYVDNGQLRIAYATADTFFPVSWNNQRITEGVFVSEIKQQGKFYTHLEWHVKENGQFVVRNELYMSNTGIDLGKPVPLSEVFEDLEEITILQGVTRPLFSYIKPNLANNFDSTLPLGISIYGNAYSTLKAIDIAYDSFIREFRLGRKRILVPAHMVSVVRDPLTGNQHRYFDAMDETYEAFNSGENEGDKIQEMNVELRVQEHIDAINAFLNILAGQMGFSAGTFSFDAAGGIKTATEVVSENSKTFKTKKSHENVIEAGLTDLIEVMGIVAAAYGLYTPPAEYDVNIAFDDSIVEDTAAIINRELLRLGARIQSRVGAIMIIDGLSEEEAIKKVQFIDEEELRTMPDQVDLQTSRALFGDVE